MKILELDHNKGIICRFHVDDSGTAMNYDIITRRYLLMELHLNLKFDNLPIEANQGEYRIESNQ